MSLPNSPANTANQVPRHRAIGFFSPLHILLQAAIAILFFVADELDRIFNLWFLLVPIIGIPVIVVGITWIVDVIRSTIRMQWAKLASVVLAPLIVWPLLVLLLHIGIDSHWVRFQTNKRDYEETIRSIESPHPIHHSWNWGTTGGAAAANIFYSLVYDETDQINLKNGEKREGGVTFVRSYGDHFYLVTQLY